MAANSHKHFQDLNDDLGTILTARKIDQIVEADDESLDGDAPMANGSGEGATASMAAAAAQGRLMRKHRKGQRAHSISEEGKFGSTKGAAGTAPGGPLSLVPNAPVRSAKNSKKSRTGFGRGLPKKGGAGGKGTWGKLGCELELPWVDPNDPNYESEQEAAADKTTKIAALAPEMSEEDVRKAVEPLILEYFENSDTMEVLYTLQEMLMNLGSHRWMIVSILIELAMDHKPSHRELASILISDLYQKVISQRDIGKAFDYLLSQLTDLILDTPEAPHVLGNFMARAIADDCIPPKFIKSYKGNVETDYAKASLRRADNLLSMKHGLVRLDNVWGVGGGIRPVKYLIKKIVMLLKEYLCSGDIQEATLCLKELEVPHFHHELVYEAVVLVIESMHEKTDEAMCKLLQSLFRSFIITMDQMRKGFERVYDFMPEIVIDVPPAYEVLERFVLRCRGAGILTDELVRKMPSRGRKRFVSEGDGGRVKENWW
ncbi:programmed cell death protein 4-like [Tigriopus californicus]|uniref:programmed cell death protein 4-like n=1 Tax=Tigriopus californicus TaxID=6832 RepID=UPI0027DA146C|nr:programmed cell death protein 4-like [Tigriopus californicus]